MVTSLLAAAKKGCLPQGTGRAELLTVRLFEGGGRGEAALMTA
ncbi:hypothetical protein ACH4Y0_34240 [Streptomyces sp. NPDC020707]